MIGWTEIIIIGGVMGFLVLMYKVDKWDIEDMSDEVLGTQGLLSLRKMGKIKPIQDKEIIQVYKDLVKTMKRSPDTYSLYQVEMEGINAFAIPDGNVILTTPLVESLRTGGFTQDHLAGVLAHELGHIYLGHSRKKLQKDSLMGRVKQGVDLVARGKSKGFTHVGRMLLTSKLSRKLEYEADEFATELLFKSQFNDAGLVGFLDKLPQSDSPWLEFTSTHPPIEDRKIKIMNRINEIRANRAS